MLRRIFISSFLFVLIFFVGCAREVSSPSSRAAVTDRSIDGLSTAGYVNLINIDKKKRFIHLRENYEQAWQSTANAAKQAGLDINEADAQRGYYILKAKEEEKEEKGYVIRTSGVLKHLESLDTSGDAESTEVGNVRIRLISLEDNSIKIVPVNNAGDWDTRGVAKATIKQLHNALSLDDISTIEQQPRTTVAATSGQNSSGLSESTANAVDSQASNVELIDTNNGEVYILLPEGFEQAWFATSRGLKRAGITVSQADSLRGIYTVGGGKDEEDGVKIRMSGIFKHFKSSESDEEKTVHLHLTNIEGNSTKITSVDSAGEWDNSDQAVAIIKQLYKSLRAK